jgi:hypothetical protein
MSAPDEKAKRRRRIKRTHKAAQRKFYADRRRERRYR